MSIESLRRNRLRSSRPLRLARHAARVRVGRHPVPQARNGRSTRSTRAGRPGAACSSTWPASGATSRTFYGPPGALRHAGGRQRPRRRSASSSPSTTSASRQNKRWDLTANQVYSLSDQTHQDAAEPEGAGEDHGLRSARRRFRRFRDRLDEYTYHSEQVTVEYIDAEQEAGARQGRTRFSRTARRRRLQGRGPSGSPPTPSRTITNAHHQGVTGETAEGLLRAGPRREGHRRARIARLQRHRRRRWAATTSASRQLVLAQQREVPADATVVVIAGPQTDFLQPEIDALAKYLAKAARCW